MLVIVPTERAITKTCDDNGLNEKKKQIRESETKNAPMYHTITDFVHTCVSYDNDDNDNNKKKEKRFIWIFCLICTHQLRRRQQLSFTQQTHISRITYLYMQECMFASEWSPVIQWYLGHICVHRNAFFEVKYEKNDFFCVSLYTTWSFLCVPCFSYSLWAGAKRECARATVCLVSVCVYCLIAFSLTHTHTHLFPYRWCCCCFSFIYRYLCFAWAEICMQLHKRRDKEERREKSPQNFERGKTANWWWWRKTKKYIEIRI